MKSCDRCAKCAEEGRVAENNLHWFIGGDGKKWLVRCPKCGLENYAPAVASGVCVWCGHDANKPDAMLAEDAEFGKEDR